MANIQLLSLFTNFCKDFLPYLKNRSCIDSQVLLVWADYYNLADSMASKANLRICSRSTLSLHFDSVDVTKGEINDVLAARIDWLAKHGT